MLSEKNTILIVEDEQPILNALALKLTHEGFSVLTATDGEEGLAIALKKRPDLLLLDILLPKIDGLDVMRRIRETTWGKSVPIILLTNLSPDDKITKQIVEDQPAYYLVKADWKLEDIVHKIHEALTE